MNEALPEAANTMASAISSGRPARFSGTPATSPAFLSALPVNRSSIAVSIGLGATALTRTPNTAASSAADFVGVEGGCVILCGLFRDRAGLAFGAGVVDGDIEAAEAGDRLVDQILDIVLAANVGVDEFRFGAQRAEFGHQRLAGVITAAGNDQVCAFMREGKSGGAANAGQGASDEDNGFTHVTSPC